MNPCRIMFTNSSNLYICTLTILIIILFLFRPGKILGLDTLSTGEHLTPTQTLVSKNSIFELGFFAHNQYLVIWYISFPERTVVWVANRQLPLSRNSETSRLSISHNGNLELSHDSEAVWSTDAKPTLAGAVEAVLLDDGNLILRQVSRPSVTLWQSFDHPTDTWLPGASIGIDTKKREKRRLVSWRSADDPAPGMFSVEIAQEEYYQFFMMWNSSVKYWKSGSWNGNNFLSAPELSYILSFSFTSNENETYLDYSVENQNVFSMLVINATGYLEQMTRLRSHPDWSITHFYPDSERGMCGKFGVWSDDPISPCTCLTGFDRSLEDWNCSRKAPLAGWGEGIKDGFFRVHGVNFPVRPIRHSAGSRKECESACLQSFSCTAYAFGDGGCSVWEGDLFGLINDSNRRSLYVKLARSELPKGKSKVLEVIIAALAPSIVLVAGGFLGCFYTRRGKRKEKKDSGEDLLCFDFDDSIGYAAQPNDDGTILRNGNKDLDLPVFSYASVSAATTSFSPDNKLGEGGFGAVYKGKLLNGQEIAMKRLSKNSGQGLEEFRNEIMLIAKLQHKNLVRLLGCCIHPDEKILVYEYMPNKSLDFFLFDSNKQELLDWETRVRIVEGVAQGLLYLHEYSRLRIIHRDLKAGNILLDGEMNPKISDFGMARIFGGSADSRARTRRIVGTYGYMAPEYALEGLFSVKSDVFSFGVLVLEIVSGKKNTGFYQTDSLNLLGHAWELWITDRGAELMDPAVGCPPVPAVLKYINVGLLCVQENPNDRPNMSSVISMLGNDVIAPLPAPKKPAFSFSKTSVVDSSPSEIGNCSVNGLTTSMIMPR